MSQGLEHGVLVHGNPYILMDVPLPGSSTEKLLQTEDTMLYTASFVQFI